MNKTAYKIINGITFYRLAAMPFLLILLFTGHLAGFKWGLLISFFTDSIDGFLARKYKIVSVLGAKLDSVGDDLTVAAGIIGIMMTNSDFLLQQKVPIIALLILFVTQIALALRKYGKTTSFHTWLAKLAAVLQALFLLVFFFAGPVYWLFYTAVFMTALDLVEEIAMVLVLDKYHSDIKGIIQAAKFSR